MACVCMCVFLQMLLTESNFQLQSEKTLAGPAGIPNKWDYLRDVFISTEM